MEEPRTTIDVDTLAACLQGESAAWSELIRLTSPVVRSLALRLTRNRQESEDLGQQVYLKLLERGKDGRMRLEHYRPEVLPLSAFIKVVTYRCFVDLSRTRQWKASRASESLDPATSLLQSAEDPEMRLRCREYRKMIAELPPREQIAFCLYEAGWTYQEIAGNMKISAGGVAATIHSARERLRTGVGEGDLPTQAGKSRGGYRRMEQNHG